MRRDDDGFAVLDIRLKALQPVCARPFEAIEIQNSLASEITFFSLVRFERPVELPSFVCRVKIVGRDENLESVRLRGFEDALHILNGVIFLKAFVDQGPRKACFTQHIILRVDKYYRGVALVEDHGFSLLIRDSMRHQEITISSADRQPGVYS